MDLALSIGFGALVGLSLGLTGAGGAILAVPLLVYGVSVAPTDAVPISLLAVGAGALIGFVQRWWKGEVILKTGLLIAGGGVVGTPLGAWLGARLPDPLLMGIFSLLLILSGVRMWRAAGADEDPKNQTCGIGVLSARCTMVLIALGVVTGILSTLFGVGGGFILVPALVLLVGMGIHHATATSLMVIALVSSAAIGTLLFRGQTIDLSVALPFMGGGVLGILVATPLAPRIPRKGLQQTFASILMIVAMYTLYSSLTH